MCACVCVYFFFFWVTVMLLHALSFERSQTEVNNRTWDYAFNPKHYFLVVLQVNSTREMKNASKMTIDNNKKLQHYVELAK